MSKAKQIDYNSLGYRIRNVDFVEAGLVAFITLLGLLLGWLLLVMMEQATGPDLATLKKNEWTCTASHQRHGLTRIGKTLVPTTTTVCDQYSRIG